MNSRSMISLEKIWETANKNDLNLGDLPVRKLLKSVPFEFDSPEFVHKKLEEWGGSGWVMFTDRVHDLREGEPLGEGVVLSAERVNGLKTLVLRFQNQRWYGWEIVEGEGEEYWVFQEKLQHIDRGVLSYDVGWKQNSLGEYQPYLSRLTAITTG